MSHCHHHHAGSCSAHTHEDASYPSHHHECHCHCHDHHESIADQMLHLADEAWLEVLKEKIKGEIIKNSGAHLDKLAKLLADSNKTRWKEKIEEEKSEEEFEHQLKHFFYDKK